MYYILCWEGLHIFLGVRKRRPKKKCENKLKEMLQVALIYRFTSYVTVVCYV